MSDDVERPRLRAIGDAAGKRVVDLTGTAHRRVVQSAGEARERTVRTAARAREHVTETTGRVTERMTRRRVALDLAALSTERKLAYCRVLVALARADGVLDPREVANLYLFTATIDLDADARTELRRELGVALDDEAQPSAADTATARATELFASLPDDEVDAILSLLLRDLVRMSRADGDATPVEREVIVALANVVRPDTAERLVAAAERLVIAEEDFASGRLTTSQFESTTKDVAAKAAAFGAPIAAISASGSVSGLSAAGITSGLATLGFGGLLGLSAMVTGIGTIVILGVAVHQGTRYALAVNERERARRREHLIQQVLLRHQQAMAELAEDIAGLAERMEVQLAQSRRNEAGLAQLRSELDVFHLALADLEASRQTFERAEGSDAR